MPLKGAMTQYWIGDCWLDVWLHLGQQLSSVGGPSRWRPASRSFLLTLVSMRPPGMVVSMYLGGPRPLVVGWEDCCKCRSTKSYLPLLTSPSARKGCTSSSVVHKRCCNLQETSLCILINCETLWYMLNSYIPDHDFISNRRWFDTNWSLCLHLR